MKGKGNMKKRELINADDAHLFWVNGNGALRNAKDLAESLKAMSEETFASHANAEKNDFANWVGEILLDKKLASDLRSAKNQAAALKKVESRLRTYYKI